MIPFRLDYVIEKANGEGACEEQKVLKELAGVRLRPAEARAEWPRVLEHKWYLSERLGRDVGVRVAAVDNFDNIEPPRAPAPRRAGSGSLPPKLPMMLRFGERA